MKHNNKVNCSKNYAYLVFLIFGFLSLSSCRKNEIKISQNALQFTSTIVGQINTKATGTSWENGDKIGIYMIKAGQKLSQTSILNNVQNQQFTTNGVVFKSTNPVFLPQETVDFLAYYPYKENTDFQYAIDLSDQSQPATLDLMYAKNAKGITQGNTTVPLIFERQLSKVSLNLTITNTDALLYNEITVLMPGVATQGSFDLKNGTITADLKTKTDINGKISSAPDGTATIDFILLPGEDMSNKAIQFIAANGDTFTWKAPKLEALEKGNRYSFHITIDNGEPSGSIIQTQPYLEIPKISSLNNDQLFIQHFMPYDRDRPKDVDSRNYAMLYDKKLKMAYWVAYPLYKSIMGSGNRTDYWQYDPALSSQFQPKLFSGFGSGSGFDRGHQLPSADRNLTVTQNKTTFYFTNMTAQTASLNQGIWQQLEEKVRKWTAQCDTMYVVTGAMPTTATNNTIDYIKDNDRKDIGKPKYYFKALAMKKGNQYYTIAYKMDNIAPPRNSKFDTYKMTVSDLEQATGFSFFPDLTVAQKGTINTKIWN